MTREKQLELIASLLMNYEEGDFLLLADLSDALTSLKDYFLDTEVACTLLDNLKRCVAEEMKLSDNEHFIERLSSAIDIIQQLQPEMDCTHREEVLLQIANFKCKKEKQIKTKETDESEGLCINKEALQIFMSEVTDRLNQAQTVILKLEDDMKNMEHIQILFRIFHTIKGECGFLKIATLGELTHNIESLLDLIRSGSTAVEEKHIELLLEGVDMSRAILTSLQKGDVVFFNDHPMESYLEKLKNVSTKPMSELGSLLIAEGKMSDSDVAKVLQKQKESAFTKRFGEIAVRENYLSAEELQETLKNQKSSQVQGNTKATEKLDPIIKVKASKVTFLVDMIGELLMTMGQMTENTAELMQMRKITRSLQYGAMELRTESIQSLFGNIKRAVRDLSKQLEKNVRFVSSGDDLEIDRNLIEKLEEPLMHLVRNSLDHGIGTPDERTAVGKEILATVTLKAERRGNSIVITVHDDGRGLNRRKIEGKAIEKNLITQSVAETMTDEQVYNLIFASGFSTNTEVSLVSGRGVGMDIVRSVVTENRGRIEIETKEGLYSEFRLVFPLSTAIIDGMITRVGNTLFVFPIGSVIESIKITDSLISTVSGNLEIAILRGETLPLIRMHTLFDIAETDLDDVRIGVVCETSDRRKFMLVLDEVIAKREVVIKSLGSKFKTLKGISSGTVLTGGKIGLVVDIDQIIDLSIEEIKA